MMLTLGQFVFQLRSAPFQELRRSTGQRWGSNNRIGKRPVYQHMGPGEDTITLSGQLMPELTGGPLQLTKLRDMQASGQSWILIDGQGYVYGQWFIAQIEETRKLFFQNGQARLIEFSLNLTRADDDRVDQLGSLQ